MRIFNPAHQRVFRISLFFVTGFLLTACAPDPIDNKGTWRVPPKGFTSNDENLRAMLVNPKDLVRGHGETSSVGATASGAAQRQLTNQRYPLPSSGASKVQDAGAGQQQAPPLNTAPAPGE